jgi:Flp pilus assembly protein TadD
LMAEGKFQEAQAAFRHALQLSPANASLQVNLGTALLMDRQTNAADAAFAQASQLEPGLANRYLAEGRSLLMSGDLNAALARFKTVVCLQPNSPNGLSGLAWLLATHPQPEMRNGPRALALAQHAVEVAASDAGAWAALDVACAENGRFQEAIPAAEKSRKLALAAGASQMAAAAEKRLALYRLGQPYHLK